MTPPTATRRLFAPGTDLDSERHPGWLIERLLEDGDSDDLRWLFKAVPHAEIVDWLSRYGARRLSRRSQALWCMLLGVPATPASELARALWSS